MVSKGYGADSICEGKGVYRMKQVVAKTVNYAADLAGINSALYELGGLIVMHDASGCNSTYATHDEPRWYSMDSLIFISGLEEYDAILGNDDKLIQEIIEVAKECKPNFIALFGSPIALMMGTDFKGIAYYLEKETGIPCFGFQTSGMSSYVLGASQAYLAFAQRFCIQANPQKFGINLLGMTPLDFGYNGNCEALNTWCKENDFPIVSNWSMSTSFDAIQKAGNASVNLVCSSTALAMAKDLYQRFGIPYVVGVPMGSSFSKELAKRIRLAYESKKNIEIETFFSNNEILLIGEPVLMNSLRLCLRKDFGWKDIGILSPTEITDGLLSQSDIKTHEECEIEQALSNAKIVIADPLYQPLVKGRLIPLPYWAYSGRMFQKEMPILIGEAFEQWLSERIDV